MLDVNIEKILPITAVRDALNKIIDEVEESDELYVVTKNGKPAAIIVGVHHLEKLTGIDHKMIMPEETTAEEKKPEVAPIEEKSETIVPTPAPIQTPEKPLETTANLANLPSAETPAITPVAENIPAADTSAVPLPNSEDNFDDLFAESPQAGGLTELQAPAPEPAEPVSPAPMNQALDQTPATTTPVQPTDTPLPIPSNPIILDTQTQTTTSTTPPVQTANSAAPIDQNNTPTTSQNTAQ